MPSMAPIYIELIPGSIGNWQLLTPAASLNLCTLGFTSRPIRAPGWPAQSSCPSFICPLLRQALKSLITKNKPWIWHLRSAHQATTQSSGTSLKQELRQLFKLVHPDRLHNLPAEQAINLRSFQLLQEYLDVAKGRNGSPNQFVYNFEFYIRRDASDTNLSRIEVSLPAPRVRFHPERGPELLPDTRAAICRLLSACGLSSAVSGGLTGAQDKLSLADFFQQSSEIQRQNEAAVLNLDQNMIVVRNALRLGRGVTASFRSPIAEASAIQQLDALTKLAQALDEAKGIAIAGCTVVIGNGFGVDPLGNVWLNHECDKESWSKYLKEADLISASERRLAARARRLKEFEVAHLMEVEMIFTHGALAVHPDYSLFLHRMAQGSLTQGAVGEGKFFELPVRVSGPDKEGSGGGVGCFAVDASMGYISVPVWEGLSAVYRYIEGQGSEALVHRRRYKATEKKLEELKVQVRKALRLRNLMLDVTIGNDQHVAACTRLLYYANHLVKYTEGLSLSISDECRLPVQGVKGYAYLKWNFDIADL